MNDRTPISLDTIAAIVAELGGIWTTTKSYDHYVSAERADGFALGFHSDYTMPDNKVQVSLIVPSEFVRFSESRPKANVTLTRDPKVIGRDLTRRLMPDAEALYATVLERQAAHNAYENKVAANVATLTEAFPAMGPSRGDTARLHFYTTPAGYGDVHVMQDTVNLDLHSVPMDLALIITSAIAAHSKYSA